MSVPSRPSQLRICEVTCFAWAHVRAPASVSCDHRIQDHGQSDSVSAEQKRRRRSKTDVDEVPREIQEKHALTILRLQKATGLDVAVGGEYENGRLSLTGTATR